jgi:hypothetical protein
MDTYIFNWITMITTGILAIAAILAYLVQRARYLREIEPDLELKCSDRIRVEKMSRTLKEFWAFSIDVEIDNRSKNHAEGLQYKVDLQISPHRGEPPPVLLGDKIPEYISSIPIHPDKVLARRRIVVPVYIGSNFAPDLQKRLNLWDGSLSVEEVGFEATITISYFSKRELILFFLLIPRCKVKYTREIFMSWMVQIDEKNRSLYVSQPWE